MRQKNPELEATLAHALELFGEVRSLRSRHMFGGAGLYSGSLFFGIVTDGGVYLKADDETKTEFEAAGSISFRYQPPGREKPVTMNYWLLPQDATDDPDEAMKWARKALEASSRAPVVAGRRRVRTETAD